MNAFTVIRDRFAEALEPSPAPIAPPSAIALRCIKPTGPMEYGNVYHAVRGHRLSEDHPTYFDVMVEGELRQLTEEHFIPANPRNWRWFSHIHRRRYGGYPRPVQARKAMS